MDELLNVDPSIEDDVAFEAADKARGCRDSTSCGWSHAGSASGNSESSKKQDATDDVSGIHFEDGKDYVRINWRDGVHVKDAKTGEEVRVGWNGIHIKSGDTDESWPPHEQDACNKRMGTWSKFPFYLIVIIAYVLVGFFAPPLVLEPELPLNSSPVGTVVCHETPNEPEMSRVTPTAPRARQQLFLPGSTDSFYWP